MNYLRRILILFLGLISFIRNVSNKFHNYCFIFFKRVVAGKNLIIDGKIYIRNQGEILIGKNVQINSSLESNPIGGDCRTILVTGKNGKITIGDNVKMSNTTINSMGLIEIDDNVFIGGGCKFYDSDFHSIHYELRKKMDQDPDIKISCIRVDKCAFVGAHSIILKGVCIGEGAVIGTGSVVTKNIPPYEIWAGNPARFIKKIENNAGVSK